MADVRAMLRASRDARKRITHPHASYTSSGKLVCNLCETVIKHESAWQSHLHTTQHNLRQTRAQDAASARPTDTGKRKRSASGSASPPAESRKKIRPAAISDFKDAAVYEGNEDTTRTVQAQSVTIDNAAEELSELNQNVPANDKLDVVTLDDFERELAELEASVPARPESYGDATILSAPLTAAELAAQAREEQSAQRGRRDLEIVDEREDAAKILEDELEEMEGLEMRAQRLRARREALRTVDTDSNGGHKKDIDADTTAAIIAQSQQADHGEDEDDNRSDDEDDDAYWNFDGR
ncbi:uncharacterized protein K489DRAFT_369952 [Dissoconium aciculare CBS 342.82]|uniref:Coiled-coil domain-containing protein 16 n=1 Tax=Dissoconium aciculare CBS 342.82 TaxID=1314786 RepID=A0A6J3M6V2_9PEZI|nr:uncharacterized protein K489DRAFT_369952 [Dissoconium aciculare CBS 342.82]KAF1823623.1 hypothetical protein K489DRAFT_369952 [Dissoconium aciculare CBS 342.82]